MVHCRGGTGISKVVRPLQTKDHSCMCMGGGGQCAAVKTTASSRICHIGSSCMSYTHVYLQHMSADAVQSGQPGSWSVSERAGTIMRNAYMQGKDELAWDAWPNQPDWRHCLSIVTKRVWEAVRGKALCDTCDNYVPRVQNTMLVCNHAMLGFCFTRLTTSKLGRLAYCGNEQNHSNSRWTTAGQTKLTWSLWILCQLHEWILQIWEPGGYKK